MSHKVKEKARREVEADLLERQGAGVGDGTLDGAVREKGRTRKQAEAQADAVVLEMSVVDEQEGRLQHEESA